MAYRGKIISGDCHIDIPWLPADLFTSNAPARLRDKMPHVLDGPRGKRWVADGKLLGWVAGGGVTGVWEPYIPGESTRLDRMEEKKFFSDGQKGLFHPTTPKLRIKDQDTDGVSGEVIYGILGLAGGLEAFEGSSAPAGGDSPPAGYGISDPEATATVFKIYNGWLSDFCKTNPDRLAGLASLICHSPREAAKELTRAAKMGLRGAELNASGAVKPIFHRAWGPLWEAAAEHDMPVSFHTLGLNPRQPDPQDAEAYKWVSFGINITLFQMSGAEFITSIIFSGACDRYPNFKFILGECGIGWIPYVLYRMDEEYDRQLFHLGLSLKPSEFWHRQGYSTFQIEHLFKELVDFVGEDNIIWGSDYPHPDCVWPDSRKVIEENMGHLERRKIRKIVCDNTARLYRFPN